MSRAHHILIIDDCHQVLQDALGAYEVVYMPTITEAELEVELAKATILIMRSKLRITKEWIDRAPLLELLGRLGSGMDNIDVVYAAQRGIKCINAPEGNSNAVAEQTIGMMIGMLANVSRSSRQVRNDVWDRKGNQGKELKNLCVGIIGYGNVGSALAKLLHVFGCKVLAYDKFKVGFGNEFVEEVSLEKLKSESDLVTLHVPLNEFSHEMINQSFISEMVKSFYLLNLSRGNVVKMSDIIFGLKEGKILGASLDVLPNEDILNLTDKEQKELDYLSENEDVIVTPHIGGLTADSYKLLAEVLVEKINNWIKK
jgi:D-3-phosphoglycerate dehydrogenase